MERFVAVPQRALRQPGQIAFPIIGEPLPDCRLYAENPSRFALTAGKLGRDWIFHVRIRRPLFVSPRRWEGVVAQSETARLCRLLGLNTRYFVEPLEFLPGREPEPSLRSPWVFTQRSEVRGQSKELALASALASAEQKRSLPPWVLLSGTVQDKRCEQTGSPLLGPVGELPRKIKLALGIGEGNAQVLELLANCYTNLPANFLGPQDSRTVPGGVRLFLGPGEVEPSTLDELRITCHIQEVQPQLSIQALAALFAAEPPRTAREFAAAAGFEPLGDWPAESTDWMVFAQVRTLADALAIQGLEAPWGGASQPPICHLIIPQRTADGRFRRDEQDWKSRCRVLAEFLDQRMQERPGSLDQLRAIIELFVEELNRQPGLEGACFNGTVGRVSTNREKIYVLNRVFPARGSASVFSAGTLFPFFPATSERTAITLTQKRATVFTDKKGNPAIQQWFHQETTTFVDQNPQLRPLVPEQKQFLQMIGSSVSVPVCDPAMPEPIGLLTMVLDRPIQPDLVPRGLLQMYEDLTARYALGPFQRLTAETNVVPRNWRRLTDDPCRQRHLYADLASLMAQTGGLVSPSSTSRKDRLAESRRTWANDLARKVCVLPNVYRAAVRFLDQDGILFVEASHGDFDPKWLDLKFQVVGVPLAEQGCTAGYAIQKQRDVFIDDTKYLLEPTGERISHLPVDPVAAAHASVLLEFCGQILGVLSVDFSACFIPEAIRTALHQQAAQYALVLKASRIDDEFSQLDTEPDLTPHACVSHVAQMIGARYGAFFQRDRNSGLYKLAKEVVGHSPAWVADWKERFPSGARGDQELFGWVIQNNRSLRLPNAWDPEQLELATAGGGAPLWLEKWLSEREFGVEPIAYLAVPVSVGEVHGVLRFVNLSSSPGGGFTTWDEQIARAAASRLAVQLDQKRTERCSEADRNLFDLFWKVSHEGDPQRSLAVKVFEILQNAIGECSCGIRLVDEVILPDGTRRTALRRLAHNDPSWNQISPLYRYEPNSPDMHCFLRPEEVIDVEDREKDLRFPDLMEANRRDLGHFFMCPLEQGAGVLHVTRKHKGHLFSRADRNFVRRLGGLLGPMMNKVASDEQVRFEHTILRRLVNGFGGAKLVTGLGMVLHHIRELSHPDWCGIWALHGDRFLLHGEADVPLLCPIPVRLRTMRDILEFRPGCQVTRLPEQLAPRELLPADVGVPSGRSERDQIALWIRAADGTPLAVFALIARANETLSVRQLNGVTDFLQSSLLEFVQQRQNEEL